EYPGIHFKPAYDNAHFVQILFDNVWHELGMAILLTAIAVFFFLGEWRGTLIALITLPTSLALAVLLMVPFGLTFNSGTLFGLLASMLVSFTLTALLCASWLRHEDAREADRSVPVLGWLMLLVDPFQRWLDRLERGYTRLIRWMLKNRFWNFAGVAVIVIIG